MMMCDNNGNKIKVQTFKHQHQNQPHTHTLNNTNNEYQNNTNTAKIDNTNELTNNNKSTNDVFMSDPLALISNTNTDNTILPTQPVIQHPCSIVLVSSNLVNNKNHNLNQHTIQQNNDIKSSPSSISCDMMITTSPMSSHSTPSPISVTNFGIGQFVSVQQQIQQSNNNSTTDTNNNHQLYNNMKTITSTTATIMTNHRAANNTNNINTSNIINNNVVNTTTNNINQPAPIFALPDILESIQKSDHFPVVRHRWNTNEEIAAILIAIDRHDSWLSQEVKIRLVSKIIIFIIFEFVHAHLYTEQYTIEHI